MKLVGYDETIELLQSVFPDRGAINVKECADFLGSDVRTIYASLDRKQNPIPSMKIGETKRIIPLPLFARWLCLNKVKVL